MNEPKANWVFLVFLLPCAIAASVGVFAAYQLVSGPPPEGEYAGLGPFLVIGSFGPGFLAALMALLFGIRPGRLRMILTAVAALWTILIAPTWLLGVAL